MPDDLTSILSDTADVMELAQRDPKAAADMLDRWAAELTEIARALRQPKNEDRSSEGGFGDRVMVRAIGPNGEQQGGTN